MKEYSFQEWLFDAPITARLLLLDGGVRAEIYGGTRPHIGAVSVVSPAGEVSTRQFHGHKEGVVSERWAQALADAGFCPAVVSAGIHYDGLRSTEIQAVVELTEQMLFKALASLTQGSSIHQAEDKS